jgi:hypothetical protein
MLASSYQTTRLSIPEDSQLQITDELQYLLEDNVNLFEYTKKY